MGVSWDCSHIEKSSICGAGTDCAQRLKMRFRTCTGLRLRVRSAWLSPALLAFGVWGCGSGSAASGDSAGASQGGSSDAGAAGANRGGGGAGGSGATHNGGTAGIVEACLICGGAGFGGATVHVGGGGSGGASGAAGAGAPGSAGGTACGTATCGPNQYCRAACNGIGGGPPPPDNPSCADMPAACDGVPSCACICGVTASFCTPGATEVQCGCA